MIPDSQGRRLFLNDLVVGEEFRSGEHGFDAGQAGPRNRVSLVSDVQLFNQDGKLLQDFKTKVLAFKGLIDFRRLMPFLSGKP